MRADPAPVVARVRRDRPAWDDRDVHWAVQGIAEEWTRRRSPGGCAPSTHEARVPVPDRVVAAAPAAHVLAATGGRAFLDGGSALSAADREALARRLPPAHVVEIAGGHCLHRDAPDAWLAAVGAILDGRV